MRKLGLALLGGVGQRDEHAHVLDVVDSALSPDL
jgi:hypothetical protein